MAGAAPSGSQGLQTIGIKQSEHGRIITCAVNGSVEFDRQLAGTPVAMLRCRPWRSPLHIRMHSHELARLLADLIACRIFEPETSHRDCRGRGLDMLFIQIQSVVAAAA